MKKNKLNALYLGFLLSTVAALRPCSTIYGLGGDVELHVEDNNDTDVEEETICLFDNEGNGVCLFDEGEDDEE